MNWFLDPKVAYLRPYDGHHLFFLGMAGLLLVGLLAGRRWVRAHAELVARVTLVISILQQIGVYSWYALETGFDLGDSLPLHISRVTTIMGIAYLCTRSRALMDVIFYFSLFAYGTFFDPQRIYPATHFMGWSYFVSHVITLLLPIFAAIGFGWRPRPGSWLRAYGWFVVYFAAILVVNRLVDGNYFYLKFRPFLRQLPGWLYDGIVLVGVALGFWVGWLVARWLDRRTRPVDR